MIIRLKGGKGSGHHGHAGIPGKRGGSLPGKGGGKVVADATEYNWKAEDTVIMKTVVELPEKVSNDELAAIAKKEANKHYDVEDASVKEVEWQETSDGFYAHATIDLTPTEEEGQKWAEGGEYGEEWETWHE